MGVPYEPASEDKKGMVLGECLVNQRSRHEEQEQKRREMIYNKVGWIY